MPVQAFVLVLAAALLQHQLVLQAALTPAEAASRVARVIEPERAALTGLWRERGPTLAARLAPLLARLARRALGGPEPAPTPTYTPAP